MLLETFRIGLKSTKNCAKKATEHKRRVDRGILIAISCFSDDSQQKLPIAFVVTTEVMICISVTTKCFKSK